MVKFEEAINYIAKRMIKKYTIIFTETGTDNPIVYHLEDFISKEALEDQLSFLCACWIGASYDAETDTCRDLSYQIIEGYHIGESNEGPTYLTRLIPQLIFTVFANKKQ